MTLARAFTSPFVGKTLGYFDIGFAAGRIAYMCNSHIFTLDDVALVCACLAVGAGCLYFGYRQPPATS